MISPFSKSQSAQVMVADSLMRCRRTPETEPSHAALRKPAGSRFQLQNEPLELFSLRQCHCQFRARACLMPTAGLRRNAPVLMASTVEDGPQYPQRPIVAGVAEY